MLATWAASDSFIASPYVLPSQQRDPRFEAAPLEKAREHYPSRRLKLVAVAVATAHSQPASKRPDRRRQPIAGRRLTKPRPSYQRPETPSVSQRLAGVKRAKLTYATRR